MEYLNNFNYVEFLKRKLMLGQIDPWRRTEEGKPIFTILVPLDSVIKECSEWSGQEIHRTEFINYLKLNDVLIFRNIDEFQKIKEELKEYTPQKTLKPKRVLSEEHKEKLRNNLKKARKHNPLVL